MWFRIDDTFLFHPKAAGLSNDSLATWARAGDWCGWQLTDGVVPRELLTMLAGDAADPAWVAADLVRRNLWEGAPGGWLFHDWSDWNPTRAQVLARRAAVAERKRRHMAQHRDAVTGRVTHGVPGGVPGRRSAHRSGTRPIAGGQTVNAVPASVPGRDSNASGNASGNGVPDGVTAATCDDGAGNASGNGVPERDGNASGNAGWNTGPTLSSSGTTSLSGAGASGAHADGGAGGRAGAREASPAEGETDLPSVVIHEVRSQTGGLVIGRERAAQIAAEIIGDRRLTAPSAYVRKAIRSHPDVFALAGAPPAPDLPSTPPGKRRGVADVPAPDAHHAALTVDGRARGSVATDEQRTAHAAAARAALAAKAAGAAGAQQVPPAVFAPGGIVDVPLPGDLDQDPF
jgi:hypothetical protein